MTDTSHFTDRVIATWTHDGIECVIRKGTMALCGYAKIPDNLRQQLLLDFDELDELVTVHGGITYGDGQWIGFDTIHAGDWWDHDDIAAWFPDEDRENMPYIPYYMKERSSETQWTLQRLVNETNSLATQIAALDEAPDAA